MQTEKTGCIELHRYRSRSTKKKQFVRLVEPIKNMHCPASSMDFCELFCREQFENPYFLVRRPLEVDTPYYKDLDMEHHYPNMYDFKRAAIFNKPKPLFTPYTRPLPMPNDRPVFRHEDYRVQSDWLSHWGNVRARHEPTNLANLKIRKQPTGYKKVKTIKFESCC